MALLSRRMPRGWNLGRIAACLIALVCAVRGQSGAAGYQIKAVFLFNFTQFVEWPANAFADARAPFVIGVLGDDPFGSLLDEATRGEKVNGRALIVRRYRLVEEIDSCHILFISRSESGRLETIFRALRDRSILTVGDMETFTSKGGMVRFVTENNRVRLRVNLDAVKAGRLTMSSKLLRSVEVVSPGRK